jgi:hypothetical protein
MKLIAYLIGITLSLVGHVAAWGAVGHQTVGYIAMEFLNADAAAFVQSTIPAKYSNSLGPAATWADDVRHLSEFSWSAPFHFIDANGEQNRVLPFSNPFSYRHCLQMIPWKAHVPLDRPVTAAKLDVSVRRL